MRSMAQFQETDAIGPSTSSGHSYPIYNGIHEREYTGVQKECKNLSKKTAIQHRSTFYCEFKPNKASSP